MTNEVTIQLVLGGYLFYLERCYKFVVTTCIINLNYIIGYIQDIIWIDRRTLVSLEIGKHLLIKRMLWSCGILLIYIFGQEIPLPLVKYQSHIHSVVSEPVRAVIAGSGMANYSIFALGIGPMMIAMIVLSFAMQSKVLGLNRLPSKYNDRIQMIITILIALAQAFVSVRDFKLTQAGWEGQVQVMLAMIAGAMLIMWLCNMNAKLGLGGPMMIIMANVMSSLVKTVYNCGICLPIRWQLG